MYAGAVGSGAWRQDGVGERRQIHASGSQQSTLSIVASRSHPSPQLAAFLAALPEHKLVSMGSSLKLCLVADGTAGLYPRLGPPMEWDTGAAHAVVRAAGGQVIQQDGTDLHYNKENLLNPYFLVLGTRALPWRQAWADSEQVEA
jgi:3'(2'), 5'-bisphosphate nucleotidase